MKTIHKGLLLLAIMLLLCRQVSAENLCVWDPLGSQGDFSSLMQDYSLAALRWDVHFSVRVFTEEPASVEAFKEGQCDELNMIGIRARSFNQFTGSMDVPGGLDNYAQVRKLLLLLAGDSAVKYMASGEFETVGILPLGAVFPVIKDRSFASVQGFRGKRVAVMDWDKTQSAFVGEVGAVPVAMRMTEFGKAFNSGAVDAIPVPMMLYKALELDKGIGDKGGIIRRPTIEFTMQLIARRSRFSAGFGGLSRQYMLTQVDHALGVVHKLESEVNQKDWIYFSTQQTKEFDGQLNTVNMHLAKAGYYDKRMLELIRRIRCSDRSVNDADCDMSR